MELKLLLFVISCCICGISSQEISYATIVIKGAEKVAETNEYFVCATIDWWPAEKCDHNQCPWGATSVLNLDLAHQFLAKAIQAFKSLRIRIGGSLQDQVVYGTPNLRAPCQPFSKKPGALFGFSQGCLSTERWDAINRFLDRTGAVVTFGLNALYGRHAIRKNIYGGPWNASNARDFIKYTASKSYPIDSWEFGNELSGHGIGACVDAEQYGKDLIGLKSILDEVYRNDRRKPFIVAPGGFFEQQWYAKLLQVTGSGIVNVITHHIYNLGGGDDPHIPSRIMDPLYLSKVSDTFRDLQLTIQRNGPWASAWVGEAGGVYDSGSQFVSNTFLNSIWYLDQLGLASKYNTKAYCRQSLIGGNYGLLDAKTFIPNPDYYSALLWHRLMGRRVLSVEINGSPYLRAYAHCQRHKEGVSILLINLHKTAGHTLSVGNDLGIRRSEMKDDGSDAFGIQQPVSIGGKSMPGSGMREEYHLTASGENHLSRTMLLNGIPLELTQSGDVPPLNPVLVASKSPVHLPPLSIAFIVFPDFGAPACRG